MAWTVLVPTRDELSERLYTKLAPTYRDPLFEKKHHYPKAEMEEILKEKMAFER